MDNQSIIENQFLIDNQSKLLRVLFSTVQIEVCYGYFTDSVRNVPNPLK